MTYCPVCKVFTDNPDNACTVHCRSCGDPLAYYDPGTALWKPLRLVKKEGTEMATIKHTFTCTYTYEGTADSETAALALNEHFKDNREMSFENVKHVNSELFLATDDKIGR